MVDAWSFTKDQAARLTKDRKSWASISIGPKEQPVAVLYLDSSREDFFGKPNGARRKAIECACLGIAEFIDRRYK
jgi:hypothetical protein